MQFSEVLNDKGASAQHLCKSRQRMAVGRVLPELQGQGSRVHMATSALPTPALESTLPQTCSARMEKVSMLKLPLVASARHYTC